MSEKKRIACFFTAGYTELNAMKSFMKKINDKAEYIQLCPIGSRRSKNAIRNRHIDNINSQQNGLTGEALIDFVADFVQKKRFQEEHYDAVLIEDDKDGRFLEIQDDGTADIDAGKWEEFKSRVTSQLKRKCQDIPIIFFYAAPEVEAWFLADWDHSFGNIYKEIFTGRQNDYFNVKFRKYVNDSILTSRYKDCVEAYGYFDGKYKKLSEQLQNALDEHDFLKDYAPEEAHPMVNYSKRKQGEDMLEQIDPIVILHTCSFYFKDGFRALQSL